MKKHQHDIFSVLAPRSHPLVRRQSARTGWPPLPETPQQRLRATDARPWAEVRPTDHAAPGVGDRR
jgi:hypothetical protein